MKKYGLPKSKRLKSKIIITELFNSGSSVFVYPIKLIYKPVPREEEIDNERHGKILFACTAPKRRFKKAVDRNYIKRQIRESYRYERPTMELQLAPLLQDDNLALMYIYVGKQKSHSLKIKSILPKLHEKLYKALTAQ